MKTLIDNNQILRRFNSYKVTYTWSGTLQVEAEDEDVAVEKAWAELMKHPAPMNLFDFTDDTMEVTE
jgi:hypothetical protein